MEATKNTITQATSHPVSAEEVASNGDLLTEILLRLPIKSLIKFKAVSKPWLSLISDPGFCHRRSSSQTSASGLFLKRRIPLPFDLYDIDDDDITKNNVLMELDLMIKERECYSLALTSAASVPPFRHSTLSGIEIEQACNGLLLCFKREDEEESSAICNIRYVYNPTTRHYAMLPPPLETDERYWVNSFTLAFDPSESPHYKVICLINCGPLLENHLINILIYSSESGSWRLTRAVLNDEFCKSYNCQVVFCNGSVHWMDRSERTIFAPYFHVATEEIRYFEKINVASCYYGASRGCLHAVDESDFTVFELKKDYSKWVVKYRVDISEILRALPDFPSDFIERQANVVRYNKFAICVVRCEAEEDSFLVMNLFGKTVRYNFTTGSIYHFSDCGYFRDVSLNDCYYATDLVYEYVESLTCV